MRTDEQLIEASFGDPHAFAEFYRRHARPLAGYFLSRTRSAELAADLTAETFAAALEGRRHYDSRKGPAIGWLYGIARHKLARAVDRGRVEDRARRRLGMSRLELDDEALLQIEAESLASSLLEALPADQRTAVEARVLGDLDYSEIAARTRTSEAVIRKRVSRGLAGLRTNIEQETTP